MSKSSIVSEWAVREKLILGNSKHMSKSKKSINKSKKIEKKSWNSNGKKFWDTLRHTVKRKIIVTEKNKNQEKSFEFSVHSEVMCSFYWSIVRKLWYKTHSDRIQFGCCCSITQIVNIFHKKSDVSITSQHQWSQVLPHKYITCHIYTLFHQIVFNARTMPISLFTCQYRTMLLLPLHTNYNNCHNFFFWLR